MAWKEPGEKHRNRQLMGVGFPVALNQSAQSSVSRRMRLKVGLAFSCGSRRLLEDLSEQLVLESS